MRTYVLQESPSLLGTLWRAWATRHKRPGPMAALEDVTWRMPRLRVDASVVDRYRAVCGFQDTPGVPLTYPQLLTFPLVMAYLSSADCPWPAVGTVHLANAIEQRDPLRAGEAVAVELRTGALRAHEKGQVFDLELQIVRDGDWIWRGTQTLLRRGVLHACGSPYVSALGEDALLQRVIELEVPPGIGKQYARVSGDYNPMHWSYLGARFLGFRRMIAHGLWTQARSLAALLPSASPHAATLLTEFGSPLLLPGRVAVWKRQRDDGLRFDVRDASSDRHHVRSLFTTPLP